jgi:hypothetical protein
MNYINTQFVNCLDKTNGDTITGAIDVLATITIGGANHLVIGLSAGLYVNGNLFISGSGTETVESGGNLTIAAGGVETVDGSLIIGNTAVGSPVNGVLYLTPTGIIECQSGSNILMTGTTINIDSTSDLTFYSTATSLSDASWTGGMPTLPISVPQTRHIVQPFAFSPTNQNGGSSSYYVYLGYLNDGAATGTVYNYICALPKMMNGATLTTVSMPILNNSGSTNTAATAMTATLYRGNGSTSPTSLGSYSLPSGLTNGSTAYAAFTGLTEVVKDYDYNYFIWISTSAGSGYTALNYFPPTCTFTVSALGQA